MLMLQAASFVEDLFLCVLIFVQGVFSYLDIIPEPEVYNEYLAVGEKGTGVL